MVLPWNTDSSNCYFLPSTSHIPEPLRWFCEGGGGGGGGEGRCEGGGEGRCGEGKCENGGEGEVVRSGDMSDGD